jgi:hypothetical protein
MFREDPKWRLGHRHRWVSTRNQGPCWDAGDTFGWGKAPGRAKTSAPWTPTPWKASPCHDTLKEQAVHHRQTGLDAKGMTPELLWLKLYCSWTGDFFSLFFKCLFVLSAVWLSTISPYWFIWLSFFFLSLSLSLSLSFSFFSFFLGYVNFTIVNTNTKLHIDQEQKQYQWNNGKMKKGWKTFFPQK